MTIDRLATISKWALTVYWLALFTATHLPVQSNLPPIRHTDKVVHALAYAILALLLTTAWELSAGRLNSRHLAFAWIALVVWAAIDELTQIPVGRVADFWDWTADAAGAAAGILLFVAARRLIERRAAGGGVNE